VSERQYDVAILGSGFAGSILARVLNKMGHRVSLIEKTRHPRFALGESSTPLAALCLERLAHRYDLPDLLDLAAWGRWKRELSQLHCGLKRGFSFYRHTAGRAFENTSKNDHRLLVAASPSDAVSDCQWLREDVDHFLAEKAVEEGVDLVDLVNLDRCARSPSGRWCLSGTRQGTPFELDSDLVIDGTGRSGLMSRQLGIANRTDLIALETSLVFGHFDRVRPLAEVVESPLAEMTRGPYEDESAAVHHLLDEGWLYLLRFDDGRVSAGVTIRKECMSRFGIRPDSEPERIWATVLNRYPTIEAQFEGARALRPLEFVERVQHRFDTAAGDGWAALPHSFAFVDPLFSTGIAWSLLAVERLAQLFESRSADGRKVETRGEIDFSRYGRLLEAEADQILCLIEGAYRAMHDFDLFTAQSFLYFSTVSFLEVQQRLFAGGGEAETMAWRGFLGAGDPELEQMFMEAKSRLYSLSQAKGSGDYPVLADSFKTWIQERIACRNVIGLGDPTRDNLYPVDLDVMRSRANLLGLSDEEMRSRIHLLRGRE